MNPQHLHLFTLYIYLSLIYLYIYRYCESYNNNAKAYLQQFIIRSTMDSDSEEFQVVTQNTSFFSGFATAPKLSEKQRKLRAEVCADSVLETKQTTLDDKVSKIKAAAKRQDLIVKQDPTQISKVKITIEGKHKQQKPEIPQEKKKLNKTFQDLKLIRPLLKAISDVEYTKPTPIQQLAIPVILTGRDTVASSITGSGKTAAFLLPILQRYHNAAAVGYIRVLIVTPTRELAIQIFEQFAKLNKYTKLEGVLTIGASSIQKQESQLRNNPELVIGTPGRIIDLLMNSRSIGMENLEIIVFDEADKLLELGFEAEIKQIMSMINQEVQTVLFSATMGQDIKQLTAATTRKPIRVSADPDNKTAEKLHQQVVKLKDQSDQYREAVLLSILLNVYTDKAIVFFKTKKQCHRMTIILNLLGAKACQLHGNLSQTQRLEAFLKFKEGQYDYMMATDLAARGLDIKEVKTVMNFQLPTQLTRYIHRIGRTARAGSVGTSLTLCNDSECLQLKKMSKKTGDKLFKLTLDEKVVQESLRHIQGIEEDINNILMEEREEKDMRKADMELKKLENMTDHRDQIYSRPKKEWFMTEDEKRKIQEKAKIAAGVQPLEDKDPRGPNKFSRPNFKHNGNKGSVKKFGKQQHPGKPKTKPINKGNRNKGKK